nr:uncharacterized protein LOC109155335 [Ipomoea batatas]
MLADGRNSRIPAGDAGSDDDFVDPPPEFGGRPRNYSEEHREASPELELTPEEDQMFPTIETRGSIKVLYNVIKSLNGRQRRDVRDIGFGGLLSLDIKETPLRLGRWLLTNYNPVDRVLNLENGNAIHITSEDVADVFGFPMGSIPMVKRRKRDLGPMLVEWRENLGKPDGNISPKNVCDAMLEQRDGGEWFKRHFSVIVATTLIECSGNGTVNQQFLELLDDVADIGDLNWCECLLESLGECHTPWSEGRVQKFVGPIDFLTLLYCDRVRWGTRFGPRNYPALKDWSSQLMKTRQFEEIRTGGFGTGELLPPLRPGVNHRAPQSTRAGQGDDAARVTDPMSLGQARGVPSDVSQVQQDSMPGEAANVPILNQGQCQPNPGGGGHQHGSGVPQSSVERVMEKARHVAVAVLEFVQAVEEATRDSVVDDNLKQVVGATQKLLGLCKHGSPTVHVPDHVEVEPTFTQQEDAIWDNPNFIRGVEEIERAIQRREALKDMSSFSLGLTPPDQGVGWGDMNANAPEHQVDGHAECAGGDGTVDAVPLEGTAVSEASLVVGFLHGYYLAIWGVDLAAGRMPSSDVVGVEIFITPQPQVGVSSPVVDEGAGERGILAEPLKGLMPYIEGREIGGIGRQLLAEYISTSPDRRSSLSEFMFVLWSWVFDRSNPVMDEELWSYKERSAVWEDFASLQNGCQVRVAIVDAWASVLNDRVKGRKPDEPIRFFASTWTTTQTVVETSGDKKDRCVWFSDCLREDYDIAPHQSWATIDMFLFPLSDHGHYYIISVDLKKMKMDIIDNCPTPATHKSRYGSALADLQAFLASFFVNANLHERAVQVRRLKPKRMQMSWRDGTVPEDSGIYTMRHMESYLGQGVSGWECGLVKGDRNIVNDLRKKFMHDILVSNINTHKHSVIQCALEYDRNLVGRTS